MKRTVTAMEFNNLIESKVGLSIDEIKSSTSDNIVRHIENITDRKLGTAYSTPGLSYRGNMLLATGKIIRDIDRLFNQTFGIDN